MKTKIILILIIVVLLAGGLFWAFNNIQKNKEEISAEDQELSEEELVNLEKLLGSLDAGREPGTSPFPGVECLEDHLFAERHIHTWLAILVDGVRETIPADIGITDNCMAELHTHADSGRIHIESVKPDIEFNLGDFFRVWGEPLERKGYNLQMSVKPPSSEEFQSSSELADFKLKNEYQIILNYAKK